MATLNKSSDSETEQRTRNISARQSEFSPVMDNVLDRLALRYGTDKSTANHSYTLAYERVFGSIRKDVRSFLEIGLGAGASIRMWEEYFPNARIYGMDCQPQCRQYETGRTRVFIGDQSSQSDLNEMAASFGSAFDIIIDDGGHFMNQQITSFRCLFPHVRAGGWYVVEDLHTSYHERFGGGLRKQGTMVESAKDLIDDLNKGGMGPADPERALAAMKEAGQPISTYSETIASMHFFPSLVFVEKRGRAHSKDPGNRKES